MRFILPFVLAFCGGTAHADWARITDGATFTAKVVGNSYADANGAWFRFNSDGTLSGGASGQALTGQWEFRNGGACFNRALGGQTLPPDCIVVFVDGNQLVTVRDAGRGRQTVYTRQ